MIVFRNVTMSYGGQVVLRAQSITIPQGARVALMGPSGCGKSTFLRLAAGLSEPASGTIERHWQRVSCVFQEPRLLPRLTAAENVNVVLGDRKATLPQAREWLSRMGMADGAEKRPAELSGGMAQRVSIARALAYDGDLLLLDEPFKGLDEDRKNDLLALLETYTKGKTLLLATHDRTEAESLCETILTYKDNVFQ